MAASEKRLSILAIVAGSLVGVAMFQNCSPNKVQFNTQDGTSTAASTVVLPPAGNNPFIADPFGFTDQNSVAPGAAITSDSITLKGTGTDPVSAVCTSCFIEKNGSGTFTSTIPQVQNGDVITLRLTASSADASSVQASVRVGSTTSRVWTVTTKAQSSPTPSGPTCVSNMGQICDKGSTTLKPGCGNPDYGCAAFVGVYNNSPNGCDSNTAQSWVEYYFDGDKEYSRSSNNPSPGVLGDASSAYHCTYIGFASYDPFHNVANGACFNSSAAGYAGDNTYTRVTPGSGCSHEEHVIAPGTIQCDGSCQ